MSMKVKNPFLRFLLACAVLAFFICVVLFALDSAIQGVNFIRHGLFMEEGTWVHVLAGGLYIAVGVIILSRIKIEWRR